MRAILLAAGEGQRLRPYTDDRPKCLVPLAGRPLVLYQLAALRAAGIEDITLVTGYRADQVEALGLPTRHNGDFATTNMVASLMCARDLLDGSDDVLVSYADIVFVPSIARAIVESGHRFATAVDRRWRELWRLRMEDPLCDAETMKLDTTGCIIELGRKPFSYDDIEGQYMGLVLLSREIAQVAVAAWDALTVDTLLDGRPKATMYMTSFLQHLRDAGYPLHAVLVDGGWLEVDTIAEKDRYEKLHASGELATLVDLSFGGAAG